MIRINQWYKNLVIFLAIFFSGNILNINMLLTTFKGFLALSLISSSNYIINDIFDKNTDKIHPEKKFRYIASGKISISKAILISLTLFALSIIISPNTNFTYAILILFCSTFIYTLFLKHLLFFDIFTIAFNFVIRAISGALIIQVWISPFLILCPLFLSIFLSAGKRYSDLLLTKKSKYKKTVLKNIVILSFFSLLITFLIYCVLVNPLLLLTLPIASYSLFYYLKLILQGSIIARHPEKLFNTKFILYILLFTIATILIIYRTIFF